MNSLYVEAFVVDQVVIHPLNYMEELGPAFAHARICVQWVKVVLIRPLPFFPFLYLLEQFGVVHEAFLLAKPVSSPNPVYLVQVHRHVLLHALFPFLLLVRQLLVINLLSFLVESCLIQSQSPDVVAVALGFTHHIFKRIGEERAKMRLFEQLIVLLHIV